MKIAFIVGENGGDYFAVKKAKEMDLLSNIDIVYMFSNFENSKAINNFDGKKLIGKEKKDFFKKVYEILNGIECDFLFLSGFNWLLPDFFVKRFEKKIINSHHSLLPAHPGLFKKEKLVKSDDKFLGATLHFVDCGVDTGKKLYQAVFPNYGMEKFDKILSIYRFIQDVMIVQLLRDFSKINKERKSIYYKNILFRPSIEKNVLEKFERIYFG